jgi:phosphatidylserine/phosphatidylglycerophosphate/cardiolipin synthase-like enzyme
MKSSAFMVLVATLAVGVPTRAAEPPATSPTPVQLVETRPIETTLGNPELPAALDVWLEMLRGARRSIDMEGFYLSDWPGEPLERVLAALGEAGKRGVRVRILIDRGMHSTYPKPADSLAQLSNFAVRTLDVRRIMGGVQHAKYMLVDGEQVFLGSQNFDWRALKHIHELGVRVRDRRVAAAFGDVFEWDWTAADTSTWVALARPDTLIGRSSTRVITHRPRPPRQESVSVPILVAQAPGDTVRLWPSYSPRGWIPDSTRWDLDAILALLGGARREIVVQLLTYAPEEYDERDESLDRALRAAAARGVQVKLLISDWVVNGKGIGFLQRLAGVPNVEVKLTTLPEWSGGYIPFARVQHCKLAVVDSARTWVGTSNWGPGYFMSSRNLGLVLEHAGIARQARQVFESGWSSTYAAPVKPDYTYPEKIRGTTPPPGKRAYGS